MLKASWFTFWGILWEKQGCGLNAFYLFINLVLFSVLGFFFVPFSFLSSWLCLVVVHITVKLNDHPSRNFRKQQKRPPLKYSMLILLNGGERPRTVLNEKENTLTRAKVTYKQTSWIHVPVICWNSWLPIICEKRELLNSIWILLRVLSSQSYQKNLSLFPCYYTESLPLGSRCRLAVC